MNEQTNPNGYTSNVSLSDEQVNLGQDTPASPPVAETTVVVSPLRRGPPKWFYFIFLLVLVAFIVVTAILIITLNNKQSGGKTAEQKPSSQTEITATPTKELSPTPSVPQVDPAILKLNQLDSSDELANIETDTKGTDLTFIEDSLSALDSKIGSTSGR
ncbi:hypothetical protein MUP32_05795 [Candidatus Microgenomates bacterium]|nr:hypothetical protein [Candidatus Microgenomates bacterium]